MKKIMYTWQDLERDCSALCLHIALTGWIPDYVVGVARGGCIPAVMISHLLKVPMWTVKVSLRDSQDFESNYWLSEEVFAESKKVLIVDDINDTGATFQWIQTDWQKSCLPDDPKWSTIWNHNVKFAVLHNNEASNFQNVDFAANTINKAEKDHWIVYPWESK